MSHQVRRCCSDVPAAANLPRRTLLPRVEIGACSFLLRYLGLPLRSADAARGRRARSWSSLLSDSFLMRQTLELLRGTGDGLKTSGPDAVIASNYWTIGLAGTLDRQSEKLTSGNHVNHQRTPRSRTAAPGEVVYSEGFTGESVIYLIADGKVEISTHC